MTTVDQRPLLHATPPMPGAPAVGGYHVVGELGRGSGGIVYRAVSEASGCEVALKVFHRAAFGDRQSAERAWRELDALRGIRSQVVPRVFGYGQAGEGFYIATELIEGRTLQAHAAALGLDRRARVELIASVCDSVQVLHEHGVIHRDLKPSNVIVDPRGVPVVIDLGLSRTAEGGATLTADGVPLGTPAFMAPEQARSDRAAVSTRSDVYALGAMACLLLTGRTPHDSSGPVLEALARLAATPAQGPRTLDPAIPKSLDAVVAKALAFEPGDRYASAAELAADLRRFLRGEPVEARSPGLVRRAARAATRHPRTSIVAALLAVGIATAGIVVGVELRAAAQRAAKDREAIELQEWKQRLMTTLARAQLDLAGSIMEQSRVMLNKHPDHQAQWLYYASSLLRPDALGTPELAGAAREEGIVRSLAAAAAAEADGHAESLSATLWRETAARWLADAGRPEDALPLLGRVESRLSVMLEPNDPWLANVRSLILECEQAAGVAPAGPSPPRAFGPPPPADAPKALPGG